MRHGCKTPFENAFARQAKGNSYPLDFYTIEMTSSVSKRSGFSIEKEYREVHLMRQAMTSRQLHSRACYLRSRAPNLGFSFGICVTSR